MNILDLPATIQLGKMWRRQSTAETGAQARGKLQAFGINI